MNFIHQLSPSHYSENEVIKRYTEKYGVPDDGFLKKADLLRTFILDLFEANRSLKYSFQQTLLRKSIEYIETTPGKVYAIALKLLQYALTFTDYKLFISDSQSKKDLLFGRVGFTSLVVTLDQKKILQTNHYLGKGTYSSACKAFDLNQGREVVVLRSQNRKKEWVKTIELQKKLAEENQGIVKVNDIYLSAFRSYLYLEKMDYDLSNLIRNNKIEVTERLSIDLAIQLLSALAFLHRRELVHGDIKPGNILCSQSNDQLVCKFSDFDTLTESTNFLITRGTYEYCPIEFFLEIKDTDLKKVDCWSLGLTLLNLINKSFKDLLTRKFLEEFLNTKNHHSHHAFHFKTFYESIQKTLKNKEHPLAFLILNLINLDSKQRWSADKSLKYILSVSQNPSKYKDIIKHELLEEKEIELRKYIKIKEKFSDTLFSFEYKMKFFDKPIIAYIELQDNDIILKIDSDKFAIRAEIKNLEKFSIGKCTLIKPDKIEIDFTNISDLLFKVEDTIEQNICLNNNLFKMTLTLKKDFFVKAILETDTAKIETEVISLGERKKFGPGSFSINGKSLHLEYLDFEKYKVKYDSYSFEGTYDESIQIHGNGVLTYQNKEQDCLFDRGKLIGIYFDYLIYIGEFNEKFEPHGEGFFVNKYTCFDDILYMDSSEKRMYELENGLLRDQNELIPLEKLTEQFVVCSESTYCKSFASYVSGIESYGSCIERN